MLSYSNAINCFALGGDELKNVVNLDENVVKKYLDKCFYYFGTTDGWVPMNYVDILVKKFPEMKY